MREVAAGSCIANLAARSPLLSRSLFLLICSLHQQQHQYPHADDLLGPSAPLRGDNLLETRDEELALGDELKRHLIRELEEELLMVHRRLELQPLAGHRHELVELLLGEVKPSPVDVLVTGDETNCALLSTNLAVDALDDPLEHARVLSEAGPEELARGGALAEPVDVEHSRLVLERLAHAEVVAEVIAHVVAAERDHGEGVIAQSALDGIGHRGRRLGGDGSTSVDPVLPVERLEDKRDVRHAAAAVDKGGDGDTNRVVPLLVENGAVGDRRGEARVGVGSNTAAPRGPGLASPVGEALGDRAVGALPPHVAVLGEGDVGEDRVARARDGRGRVSGHAGAGGDAKEAVLGVNSVELAVGVGLEPRNIVANGRQRPVLKLGRGHHHGKVGLAALRRERGSHVGLLASGRGEAKDEHVLSEPALVAALHGGDAKGKALLAEKGVTTVARAVGRDLARLGEVGDIGVVGVARPGDVGDTRAIGADEREADGVEAGDELAVSAESRDDAGTHAGHDVEVADGVGGVGDLDADLGDVGADRTHGEGNNVHGTATHDAVEGLGNVLAHLGGLDPVVGGAAVGLLLRADVGDVLAAGNVLGVRTEQERVGALLLVQLDRDTGSNHLSHETVVLILAPIAPKKSGRTRGRVRRIQDDGVQAVKGDVTFQRTKRPCQAW